MCGTLFDQMAEQGTQGMESFPCGGLVEGGAELPVLREGADPHGIIETLGRMAEAVKERAVDEVEPGGRVAKAASEE